MRFIYFHKTILFWCILKQSFLLCGLNDQDHATKLAQLFASSFNLVQVTYDSDILFEQHEFEYLTGLYAGMLVDAQALKMACFYLKQRKLFSKINILVSDLEQGKKLHFTLIGHQCLGRLSIEGILFGKEQYRRLYGIQNGMQFDYAKHRDNLQQILQVLKNDGYLNAQVGAILKSDSRTKLVDVKIKINSDERFKITKVIADLDLDCQHQNCDALQTTYLKNKIDQLLSSNLVGAYYSSNFVHQQFDILKKYLARHGYPFAQINFTIFKNIINKQVQLRLNVSLKEPQHYQFFGNTFYTSQDLLNYIMFSGDPIWHLPVALVVKDLMDLYEKHGFWQIKIDGQQVGSHYKFVINEGLRATIKKIKLVGLLDYESKTLIERFFKKTILGKYYHKKQLDLVLSKMTNWFVQNGYWDLRILNIDFVSLDQARQNYELQLVLDQGARRFLVKTSVLNYPDLDLPFTKKAKKTPFKASYLQAQKKWLHDYFNKQGYSNVFAYPSIKQVNNQDLACDVHVQWDVKTEKPVLIGKTVRHGNANMLFNKLYQNLPYQAGQIWHKQKLTQAFFRIKNLGTFDHVRVYPGSEFDPLGQKPIILDLNLDHKLEFRNRLGFQQVSKNFAFKSGSTYKVGTSIIYKNATNCGDQFRFDADLTRYYRSIVGQYMRPIFIKMPLYFTVKAYSNKYDQPIFLGSKYRLYNVLQQGGLVDLAYKNYALNTGFNMGIEGIEISHISPGYARAIDFSDKLLCKQVPFLFFEPSFLLDYLDDKINPRHGMLTLLTSKAMIALGAQENYFLKFLIDQSFFIPLFKESVFAICLRAGHIFTNDFKVIMPIERFYLGGTYTIRSYEPDFAPPLGVALINQKNNTQDCGGGAVYAKPACVQAGCHGEIVKGEKRMAPNCALNKPCAQGVGVVSHEEKKGGHGEPVEPYTNQNQDCVLYLPQGGKSMINFCFEIRFPIYQNFGGVLFQDLGTLLKPGENLGQSTLLTATGFGLRYKTPIGPLRFDIGWRPGNFAWFLTIGHAF